MCLEAEFVFMKVFSLPPRDVYPHVSSCIRQFLVTSQGHSRLVIKDINKTKNPVVMQVNVIATSEVLVIRK